MLKKALSVSIITCFAVALPSLGAEEPNFAQTHHNWEIAGLKGIKSLRYGMSGDPTNKYADTISAAFKKAPVPMKAVDIKADEAVPVLADEGRVVLYVNHGDDGKEWVGLSVQQMVKMERNPHINFATDTYKTGKSVPAADIKKTLQELCDTLVADLKAAK